MLTVTKSLDGQQLMIKSHYFYSDRIKKLPTACWNPDSKCWSIEERYKYDLEKEFHDEIYYKTPEWVIFNQPMPDLSKMYAMDNSIQVPQLKCNLYDYQTFGAKFAIDRINTHNFCIIADDVGLGKTPEAIAVMVHRIYALNTNKLLIICKKSIKSQWEEEIDKFTDLSQNFIITKTGDTKKKRMDAYDEVRYNQQVILITNYHTFLNDESILCSLGFDFVLIDEAHCISSHDTKMNKAIQHTVQGKPCLFLTGTPVMSKPEQSYGIISIANAKYFGAWGKFKSQFIVEQFQGNYTATIGARNLSTLRNMIQEVMIRRTEYEVSVQLPKTIENNINCILDKTQSELIKAISEKRESLLADFETKMILYKRNQDPKLYQELQQTDASIKGLIAATQATADDPRMFTLSTSNYLKKNFLSLVPSGYKMSSKVEKAVDIVDNIITSGHKVIIFTKFRTSAVLLKVQLEKDLALKVVLYTGDETEKERDVNIKLFKTDDDYSVLIGTEAMAEGLNITIAKYVINFNLPDTAAIYTQRIGRVRRVSSTFNNVIVYNLITEGSKDEERWANIEKNKDMQGALVSIDDAQRAALATAMKGQ